MRTAIPPITESADDLKQRLQREHDGHKKPRLQMLYLPASCQAHTRQDVAQLLGVHRSTIGRWLALSATGGLAALLATHIPAGPPVSLTPAVLASLEQALRRPEGFASSEALRQWVRRTHGVEVKYKTLYTLVQSGPAEPHKKILTPSQPFRRAVLAACSRRSRPLIRAPSACSASTKAASVY
jgi:transposase